MSLNIRGINDFKKRRSVFHWIERQKADIVLLQETYSSKENEKMWRNEWGGKVFYSHGTKHSRGLAVLINNKLVGEITEEITDQSGRILMLKTELSDNLISWVVNVYAPNDDNSRTHLFRGLEQLLNKHVKNNEKIVIGGDFNVVLNECLDKKGGVTGQKSESRKIITQIMENFDLVDIWRVKNPNVRKYTWRQPTPPVHCRLDYFLISDSLQDNITDTEIIPAYRSDHSGIYVDIHSGQQTNRGRGYWKFNSQLLTDDEYTENLKLKIQEWKMEGAQMDNRQSWEWLKYNIRNFSREFSKKSAINKKDKIDTLTEEIQSLETQTPNSTVIKEKRTELERLMNEKTEGIILRSKVRWYEEGEKSTKYFFNLEKRNYQKKTMRKLNLNGDIIEDPKVILNEQKNFYQNLYTSQNKAYNKDDENLFFRSPTLPKLSDEESKKCDGLLKNSECYKALKTFGKNKSPGNDGLTSEFYLYFWPYLGDVMVKSFNTSYQDGLLSTSQRQAVITLIEKKGKDRTLIKNWRPISLLNIDYKIATKALTMRLTTVLPNIIHSNQSGYVKNRNITDSIRSILDISEYLKRKNQSSILLSLDFQKAFDSLEWCFMLKALQVFKFGESFIKWIRLIYTDVTSCIINDGHTSGYFKIGRGVRQGDPLSAFLFIIALELLSHTLREDKKIEGVKIGNEEIKLVQFADDTSPILKDRKSIKPLFNLLDTFAKVSGLIINVEKTEVMWIGKKMSSIEKIEFLPQTKASIKLLGVAIAENEDMMSELNIEQKLRELSATFNLWNQRNLTIEGRILLAKSIGFSKFNYIASVINISKPFIKRIESCLYKFIWKGNDKVRRNTIIQDYKNGGLKMLDLDTAQRKQCVKWIQRFLEPNIMSPWKSVLNQYMKPYGDLNLILFSNFDEKEVSTYLPNFYQSMLHHWKAFYTSKNDYGKQHLWFNEEIKIKGKCVFEKEMNDIGIETLSDLYSKDGKAVPFNTWVEKGLNPNKYFKWRALISCTWSKRLHAHKPEKPTPNKIMNNGKDIEITEIGQRDIYNFFLKTKLEDISPLIEKYKVEYDLSNDDVEYLFLLPRKCTIDHKLRELQYKIIYRYLPTNKKLLQYNLMESNTCDLCHISPESIKHLFWECNHSKTIWIQFYEWWNNIYENMPQLNETIILFGTRKENKDTKGILLFNHLLLLIKKHIFHHKTQQINFRILLRNIYETMIIEKQIGKKNNCTEIFLEKWGKCHLALLNLFS